MLKIEIIIQLISFIDYLVFMSGENDCGLPLISDYVPVAKKKQVTKPSLYLPKGMRAIKINYHNFEYANKTDIIMPREFKRYTTTRIIKSELATTDIIKNEHHIRYYYNEETGEEFFIFYLSRFRCYDYSSTRIAIPKLIKQILSDPAAYTIDRQLRDFNLLDSVMKYFPEDRQNYLTYHVKIYYSKRTFFPEENKIFFPEHPPFDEGDDFWEEFQRRVDDNPMLLRGLKKVK